MLLQALPVAKSQGTIQGTWYSTNEQNALPNFQEYFQEETTIPWLGYRIKNLANLTVELARNELISLLIPSAATRTTGNHSKFDTARRVVIAANVTAGNDKTPSDEVVLQSSLVELVGKKFRTTEYSNNKKLQTA